MHPIHRSFTQRPGLLVAVLCLLLAGCDYDVPLSAKPDREIDAKLLGKWLSPDGWMLVSRYDAEHYVVFYDGAMYRAWHSAVAGLPLLTLRALDTETPKYAYLTYSTPGDGKRLDVRLVREEIVSKKIKDTGAMRAAIEQQAGNPALLSPPLPFAPMK